MQNHLKKYLLLILVIIILNGCAPSESDVKVTPEMDKSISEFIVVFNKDRYGETEKQFEVHKVYGTKEKNGVIEVYMYSLYEGYNRVTGATSQSGGSYPVRIKLKKDGEKYLVVDYKEPEDGIYYASSIKKMFPPEHSKKAFNDTGNIDDLQQQMAKQVENWLNETK